MRVCPRCRSIFTGEGEFCSIDGVQLVDGDTDPLIGERIDRYEFVERLGTGAMGVVYRVRHTELDRDFAIKVLFGEYGSNKSLVARFRREAKAMSRMSHPNVVSVVDFGATEHGLNFLVMERIDGITLEALIEDRGRIAPRHAGWIARQIAAGLGEAHRLGFVHRDVKPANVMLSGVEGREHVKVLDFGIVGVSDSVSSTKLTGTGRIVGTPRYMSPEQARAANVGPPADLYSLGVILYEMLAGDVPFPGDVLADVLVMHSTEEPEPLPPADGLEHVVDALLVKRFEDRVQSAAEVIARLDACFDDLAPSFPSVIEDDIPTERPASAPRVSTSPGPRPTLVIDRQPSGLGDDLLEVPPLAEDEPPLVPFPRSNSSLEPIHDASTSDASIYDSAPAAFDDEAFAVSPRETSGFDAPGSEKLDALAPSVSEDVVDHATLGGVSDHLVAAVEAPPARRGILSFLIATGVLSMLALGVVIALPRFDAVEAPRPRIPMAPPAPAAEAAFVLPYLIPLELDHRPLSAGADRRSPKPSKRKRRRAPVTSDTAATTASEAPRLSVDELEISLGHVLARRGLSLEDLDDLRSTRKLARAWRSAREDQTEAESVRILGNLIEATRRANVTRRMLVRKARRVRSVLTAARPSLSPQKFAELDKRLRAREFEAKKVAPAHFDRVAAALTELGGEVAASVSSERESP